MINPVAKHIIRKLEINSFVETEYGKESKLNTYQIGLMNFLVKIIKCLKLM